MPNLPMYLHHDDLPWLLHALNDDEEIAFVVAGDASRQWRAVPRIECLTEGVHTLWHVPGGLLPLVATDGNGSQPIPDPWSGWTERRMGGDPHLPWFGDDPVNVFLHVRATGREGIGISSFSWIGNYWRPVGKPAPPQTEKWWARLRSRIKKVARRVPRVGPLDGPKPEIWVFPHALARFEAGAQRDQWSLP